MSITLKRLTHFFISLSLTGSVFALDLRHGEVIIQGGAFISSQGKAQHININGLIGNEYTVDNRHRSNGLFGAGYFVKGMEQNYFDLFYGVNGFYLGNTPVSGLIIQEQLFTNLSYGYKIQNTPVYLAAKAKIKNSNEAYNFIVDAGIGPNFMKTSQYNEIPLDTFTLPDNAFRGQSQTTFSATAGIGVRLNNFLGKAPVECGYRFFYLGNGQLRINNSQVLNAVTTGDTYANAIMCALIV